MLLYVLLGILIFVALPLFGFLLYGLLKTYHRGKEIPLETLDLEQTHYAPYADELSAAIAEIKQMPYEPVRVKSRDGITLAARYYDFGFDRTVIALHGYRAIPYNNVHAAFLAFRDLGFNILLVSHRAHFESGGRFITFGQKESGDLLCWIDYLRKRDPGRSVGLYGVSMGCATICYAAETLNGIPEIAFLVLECGYRTGYESVSNSLRDAFGREKPLLCRTVQTAGKLFLGIDMKRCDTDAALPGVGIPAFFIHGGSDRLVPVSDSEARYETIGSSIKDIVIVKGAGHAEAFLAGRSEITSRLREFLNRIYKQEI